MVKVVGIILKAMFIFGCVCSHLACESSVLRGVSHPSACSVVQKKKKSYIFLQFSPPSSSEKEVVWDARTPDVKTLNKGLD